MLYKYSQVSLLQMRTQAYITLFFWTFWYILYLYMYFQYDKKSHFTVTAWLYTKAQIFNYIIYLTLLK